ncbi:MAG: PIN domain-containing protein [Verrucomicrobiales bacterium]
MPVSEEIAVKWAELTADAKRSGITVSAIDGLIAATALVHNLTLVARNVRNFQIPYIRLLNPWDD